jgi:hypothetical protein
MPDSIEKAIDFPQRPAQGLLEISLPCSNFGKQKLEKSQKNKCLSPQLVPSQ